MVSSKELIYQLTRPIIRICIHKTFNYEIQIKLLSENLCLVKITISCSNFFCLEFEIQLHISDSIQSSRLAHCYLLIKRSRVRFPAPPLEFSLMENYARVHMNWAFLCFIVLCSCFVFTTSLSSDQEIPGSIPGSAVGIFSNGELC